jgi:hypothetical protein
LGFWEVNRMVNFKMVNCMLYEFCLNKFLLKIKWQTFHSLSTMRYTDWNIESMGTLWVPASSSIPTRVGLFRGLGGGYVP